MADPDSYPSDIPYLRTLRDRLWERKTAQLGSRSEEATDFWAKLRVLYADLEQLPYTLQGAYEALIELAKSQELLLEKLDRDHKLNPEITYLVNERDRNTLGYRLDTFVETARRCQNATTLYISRTLDLQLPASLRVCADKLEKGQLSLPEELARLIQHYWVDSGKKLRDYRDLSQHHLILSSDARVIKDSARNVFLYLVLPNNPAEKSMRRLAFSNPTVHALPYAIGAYQHLYNFCYLLAAWLLAQTGEVVVGPLCINQLPRLPFGAPGGEPILWIEPLRISSDCWRLRGELETYVKNQLAKRAESD